MLLEQLPLQERQHLNGPKIQCRSVASKVNASEGMLCFYSDSDPMNTGFLQVTWPVLPELG